MQSISADTAASLAGEQHPRWRRLFKAEMGRDMVVLTSPLRAGKARIGSLSELPSGAWLQVATPSAGYNYRVDVQVLGATYVSLLDTGASTNAVPEELVINLINRAYEQGMTPNSPEWPVALEKWTGGNRVTGVAKGQDLEIIGAAIIPITFTGMDQRSKVQRLRFKVFGKGCSSWMGFIIGGPSLEEPPLGLGLRTTPHAHCLHALGLNVVRGEANEVSERMDAFYLTMPVEKEEVNDEELPLPAIEFSDDPIGDMYREEMLASSDDESESDGPDATDRYMAWMSGSVIAYTPRDAMSPILLMAD